MILSRKATLFWPVVCFLVLSGCTSKRMAEQTLAPPYTPHAVVGDVLQFTLAYNRGAATGITLGALSRPAFTALALLALAVLGWLYRRTAPTDRLQTLALALIAGGAAGNLLDRLRWAGGVVDFIDLGVGAHRFYTFNLADVGVTFGAALLAILLWRRSADASIPAATE
jgi:signal peptidase II